MPLHSFKEHDALPLEKSTRNGITAVIEIWEGSGACISGLPSRVFVLDYRIEKSRDPKGEVVFHRHGQDIPVWRNYWEEGSVLRCLRAEGVRSKKFDTWNIGNILFRMETSRSRSACKGRIMSHVLPNPGNGSTTNPCGLSSLLKGWHIQKCLVARLKTHQRSWDLSDPQSTKGSGKLRVHPMGECAGVTKSK